MSPLHQVLLWVQQGGQSLRLFLGSQHSSLRVPLSISLGAIAGALSRYYLTLGVAHWLGTSLPIGTFLINLSGAFVMGVFTTLAVERSIISPDLRLTIAVGFLGSYTTFSTYQLDAEKLLSMGQWPSAVLYWVGSAVLGVLCLEFGCYLARKRS
jgi:fluoride exporter